MAQAIDIMTLAKSLNLTHIANGEVDLSNERLSNIDYLYDILKAECDIRYKNKVELLTKKSRLPNKIFDDSKITKGMSWQIEQINDFDFRASNQNIFIIGKCCTGKTSLAATIGRNALNRKTTVLYYTFDDFMQSIGNKTKWLKIKNSDLIIIDELFYTTPSQEELLQFYKSTMFLCETSSLVLITNRELSSWKRMELDKHLVETLLTRLSYNSQQIHL